ncbi:MAG: hypothetical protein NTU57_00500 [Candidatus Aenigmarchaeota archaeon]|nr:hypothetical protein [Candidatus Aenigmarchaeota archaeon]
MALSLSDIMETLPQLLMLAQIVMYFVLSWIFGSFAFRGMKKKIPFAIRIVAMLGAGFLCVMAGAAIRGFMFFFKGTIFEMIQLDLFIGGIIAAGCLGAAFYLITRDEEEETDTSMVKKLTERVKLLEGLLVKSKVTTLKEDEVKKTAEALVKGYKAKQANLKNTDWEVLLEKDKKKAVVVMGAYTGEVKKIDYAKTPFSDPFRLGGIALIIALLVFSVLFFKGLPSVTEGVASMLGMNDEQFKALTGGTSLPEGCVPTVRILMSQGINMVGSESAYMDEALKASIESATGRKVLILQKTEFQGEEFTLAITFPQDMSVTGITNEQIMQNAEVCSAHGGTLCDCVKIPDMNKLAGGL